MRLQQAVDTGDPNKVLIQTDAAIALFKQHGWPDDWITWTFRRDEAEMQLWADTPK